MKNCEYFRELISRFVDKDLSKREQIELEEHLAECEDCREFMIFCKGLPAVMDDEAVEPPDTLLPSVMRSVRAEKAKRRRRIVGSAAGVLAASVALVLVLRGTVFDPARSRESAADNESESMLYAPTGGSGAESADTDESVEEATVGGAEDGGAVAVTTALDADSDAEPETAFAGASDEPSELSDEASDKFAEQSKDAKEVENMAAEPSTMPAPQESAAVKEPTGGAPSAEPTATNGGLLRDSGDSDSESGDFGAENEILLENGDDIEESEAEDEPSGMSLRSAKYVAERVETDASVADSRLAVDENSLCAIVLGGDRAELYDEQYGAVARSMLDFFRAMELEPCAEPDEPGRMIDCAFEYFDGRAEKFSYSAAGYLRCGGGWYSYK